MWRCYGGSNIFITCGAGFWTSSVKAVPSSGDTTNFKDLRPGTHWPFAKFLVSTKFCEWKVQRVEVVDML